MVIKTTTSEMAARLELSEATAWIDLYAAAPADYTEQYQLQVKRIGHLVILLSGVIPFPHFNCVMGLGLVEPATEQVVDEVLDVFRKERINSLYVHHIPHSLPDRLPQWLQARNLRVKSGWDRIYRGNEPLTKAPHIAGMEGCRVERVAPETAAEWADFIVAIYGVPTKPWLMALVGRAGWHHYVLRRDSAIVAARSMYLHPDGMAWLGIDAPVPGIMAPSFDLDFQLCQATIADGVSLGAKSFITDIEAPSPAMDTPAYHNFEGLGFSKLYLRSNYGY